MPPSPSRDSMRYRGPKSVPGCIVSEKFPENWTPAEVSICEFDPGCGDTTPIVTWVSAADVDASTFGAVNSPVCVRSLGIALPHCAHETAPVALLALQ